MLLVHKSRRTSSRVFQPLSLFCVAVCWYERFSTNDKRNYFFFSWNNIWSWPLCYCFSLIAGHNKTGLFFCLLKLTCDCCEEWSHCCSIDSALGSVKRWLQRCFCRLYLVVCSICARAAKGCDGCDHFNELFMGLVSYFCFPPITFLDFSCLRFDLILLFMNAWSCAAIEEITKV